MYSNKNRNIKSGMSPWCLLLGLLSWCPIFQQLIWRSCMSQFLWVQWKPSANHHSDVIMSTMASQLTTTKIFRSIVYSGANQRNIKAPRHWPLWGELTCDRWIPQRKGQQRGTCFHLLTSSCKTQTWNVSSHSLVVCSACITIFFFVDSYYMGSMHSEKYKFIDLWWVYEWGECLAYIQPMHK